MVPRPEAKLHPLPNLTAVRFFAALLVLFHHLTVGQLTDHPLRWPEILAPFAVNGFAGVSLFFVLSGFILAYNHVEVRSKRRFYLARFARVYPLYLFAALWMLPTVLHRGRAGNAEFMYAVPATLLLLQTWWPPFAFTLNVAAWTLSCEAFFYLVFPFAIDAVYERMRQWMWWIAALWVVTLLLPPFLVVYVPWRAALHISARWVLVAHYALFVPVLRLGEFLIGMFVGARFRSLPHAVSGGWVALVTVICVALLWLGSRVPHEIYRNAGMTVPFAMLVYCLAGWRSKFFEKAFWQIGGEISYAIYLFQFPVAYTLMLLGSRLHVAVTSYMVLAVIFPAAFAGYVLVEKPARVWILRTFGMSGSPKPIPTTPVDLP